MCVRCRGASAKASGKNWQHDQRLLHARSPLRVPGHLSTLARRIPQLPVGEGHEAKPTLKQLERFARATHTPVGYLFCPSRLSSACPSRISARSATRGSGNPMRSDWKPPAPPWNPRSGSVPHVGGGVCSACHRRLLWSVSAPSRNDAYYSE